MPRRISQLFLFRPEESLEKFLKKFLVTDAADNEERQVLMTYGTDRPDLGDIRDYGNK